MYERFSDSVRAAVSFARDLAIRRGDPVCHTGHLLAGICTTMARRENRILERLDLGADAIESHLDADPAEPVRRTVWFLRWFLRPRTPQSDAFAYTIESAVANARDRSSPLVHVNDILLGLFAAGPNDALRLLDNLGIDDTELRESCSER